MRDSKILCKPINYLELGVIFDSFQIDEFRCLLSPLWHNLAQKSKIAAMAKIMAFRLQVRCKYYAQDNIGQ